MKSHLGDPEKPMKTKDRILLESAILFAHHGYAAVSVRDIADKVKIKPASLYAHFTSKEEIFDVILDNVRDTYLVYYARLEKDLEEATSFEDVVNSMFVELIDIYDIYIYYGVSLITMEQYSNEKARNIFNEVLINVGVDYTKARFDECIEKKWVKPFDTKTLATILMNSVLVGSLMRTHEDMGHKTAYDAREMFLSLQRFILDAVDIIE